MKPTDHEIRISAYEIFCSRAGQGGSPEEDWLLAEQQLKGAKRLGHANVSGSAFDNDEPEAHKGAHITHHFRNHHP